VLHLLALGDFVLDILMKLMPTLLGFEALHLLSLPHFSPSVLFNNSPKRWIAFVLFPRLQFIYTYTYLPLTL
jgi:hypothetical protein